MNKKEWNNLSKEIQHGLIISYINGIYDNLNNLPKDFIADLGLKTVKDSCNITLLFKLEDSIKEIKLRDNYTSIFRYTRFTFNENGQALLSLGNIMDNTVPIPAKVVVDTIQTYGYINYQMYSWLQKLYDKLEKADILYNQHLINKKIVSLLKENKFLTLENRQVLWHNYRTNVGKLFRLQYSDGYVLRPRAIIHDRTYYFENENEMFAAYGEKKRKIINYHISSEDEIEKTVNTAIKSSMKDIKKYYS